MFWALALCRSSNEALTLKASTFESLYGGQFTLSILLIKSNYLVFFSRGFIKSQLPALYRRLSFHKLTSHRRLCWLTQAPTPTVIATPALETYLLFSLFTYSLMMRQEMKTMSTILLEISGSEWIYSIWTLLWCFVIYHFVATRSWTCQSYARNCNFGTQSLGHFILQWWDFMTSMHPKLAKHWTCMKVQRTCTIHFSWDLFSLKLAQLYIKWIMITVFGSIIYFCW